MNKLILLGLVSVMSVPSLLSAHNGSDDIPAGMPHPEMGERHEMRGSGMSQSGMVRPPKMGSGETRPPMMGSGKVRPPMGTGAMMPPELKGLHLAIADLKPEDRAGLVKMIKEYLTSKGIDLAKYADVRDEIRDVRKEGKDDMKNMRDQMKDRLKDRREEMRTKIKELKGRNGGER